MKAAQVLHAAMEDQPPLGIGDATQPRPTADRAAKHGRGGGAKLVAQPCELLGVGVARAEGAVPGVPGHLSVAPQQRGEGALVEV